MVSVADPQAVSPSRSGNAARLQISSSSSNPHVQRLLCPWLTTCGTALEAHENVTRASSNLETTRMSEH